MWFALAGCGLVVLHPVGEIVKGLRLAAAVWSPNHHFGNLGIDERTLDLILHALVKLSAAEIEPGVGRVDLRINREALAVLETKPVLEIHRYFLSAVIRRTSVLSRKVRSCAFAQ